MTPETLPEVLGKSADVLEGGSDPRFSAADDRAVGLLRRLGYLLDDDVSGDADGARQHRIRMLRAGAMMKSLFLVPMPLAPRLFLMGGMAHPDVFGEGFAESLGASVSGTGATLRQAFESCVGEGVELLSQFEQPGDIVAASHAVRVVDPFPSASVNSQGFDRMRTVEGVHLLSGQSVHIPADRCLRPRQGEDRTHAPFALSTGCGAGRSLEAATLHGLLELIERDALALWWRGGRAAAQIDFARPEFADVRASMTQARDGEQGRWSWALDITTDVGVPCVVAISVDESGRKLACGSSARLSRAEALASAFREMCQMEISYDMVEAKLQQFGPGALNAIDRRHLARATGINVNCHPLLLGTGPGSGETSSDFPSVAAEDRLTTLVRRLEEKGIEVFRVNLTRKALAIHVARVIAPDLQLDPCAFVSERLKRQREMTGVDEPQFPLT